MPDTDASLPTDLPLDGALRLAPAAVVPYMNLEVHLNSHSFNIALALGAQDWSILLE